MKARAASRYMNPGEAAAAFGVSLSTVRTWADQGRLACIKTLGGHRRYDRAQIEALIRSNDWPSQTRQSFGA